MDNKLLNAGGTSIYPSKKRRTYFTPQFAAKHAKNAAMLIFNAVAGFVLGACAMPFDVYPCGTALVCASGRYAPAAYLGAAAACLMRADAAGSYFAVNTLVIIARVLIFRQGFGETPGKRFMLSAAVGILYGTIMALFGGSGYEYILGGISYAICLPAATVCIYRAGRLLKQRTFTADSAVCTTVLLCTYALAHTHVGKFLPAAAFCGFAVLFASSGGSLYGMFYGAMCGIAWHGIPNGAAAAVSLAFAGGVAGIFRGGKKINAATAFILCFFASSAYFDLPDFFGAAISCGAGCAVYTATASILPMLFVKPMAGGRSKNSARVWEKLSYAFSALSDTIYNVSDKLKYPSHTEVRDCVARVMAANCGSCAMCANCYSKKLYEDGDIEDIICTRLCAGGLKKSDFPEKYADSCIKITEITDKLNESYSELVESRFRDNKTEILASEYSSMARLLRYTSQKVKTDTTPDRKLAEAANAALSAIGLRFSSVEAYGDRIKTVEVHGIKIENFPCTSEELAAYMSEKCGYLFCEPKYIGCGEKMTMRLVRKRKFEPEYARSACAKGGSAVSGDSVNFFESDEHYFYALISDGMGSGRSAALTSRLTSVFIEKLLTTGAHKGTTLEMLNNLLLSKNDESFATVDLLEIDLLTGNAQFIKAGAAPAYIMRAAKLYKIASFTPPAGIIRSFNAEKTCFTLERGDTVLMLSDGIVQSSDDAPWLCEMLSADVCETPSQLTAKVLSKARRINQRDDDMTCVAVRIL